MQPRLLAVALILALASCALFQRPAKAPPATESANSAVTGVQDLSLAKLVQRYQDARHHMWPRKSPQPQGRLESVTPSAYKTYHDQLRRIQTQLDQLAKKESDNLSEQDSLTLRVLAYNIADELDLSPYRGYEIPFTSDSGFYQEISGLHLQSSFSAPQDYENYLKQLKQVPRLFDEHIANMRSGIERGFAAPALALRAAISNIEAEKDRAPEASPFYRPFVDLPESWQEPRKTQLRTKAKAIIEQEVLPSYTKLLNFLQSEYLPKARPYPGISTVTQGGPYYRALIKHYTNLPMTAIEIHELGKAQVKRIKQEMDKIRENTGFEGDHAKFLKFLRSDPQFYAKTPQELLMHASRIAKHIDARLLEYFDTLPQRPYGVFPVPSSIAPYYTAGRYVPAAAHSRRAAQYWVNTYALESRPLYALPALTAHEAVPGHHLQISLHQENEEIPQFRRESGNSAYVEGWALYSEKLAQQLGIYQTPYEHFGRLSYEMWRACRLVVDTGLHAMQWSRKQAIDYMLENTALSQREIETEVDRYISWPGQALSYKVGEIEILRLLELAKSQLGENFEIRGFHRAILGAGPLPLPLLEPRVKAWIEAEQASTQDAGHDADQDTGKDTAASSKSNSI